MGINAINHKLIVTALCGLIMYSLPAQAQESAESLLAQLRNADSVKAARLDRALQIEWSKTGSASMNLMLKRGRDALEAEDYLAAIEHLTALTDYAPEFAEGWHLRATAYYQVDLYGPALGDLQTALALNPDNYNAMFGFGVMLEEFGDIKRAYEAYLRVQAIHPNHGAVSAAIERLEQAVLGQPT